MTGRLCKNAASGWGIEVVIRESISIPWQLCLEQTWQAYCADTIPVGAVIVDSDTTVVAIGRNHVYEQGGAHPLAGSVIAHAEIDALQQLRSADEIEPLTTFTQALSPAPYAVVPYISRA